MKYLVLVISLFVLIRGFNQVSGTSTEVNFEFDSYELTKQAKTQIDIEINLYNSTSKIMLIGYADKIGKSAYNQVLSEKRCRSVQQYLILKGVLMKSIVSMIGKGERKEYPQLSKNRAVLISSSQPVLLPPSLSEIIKEENDVSIEDSITKINQGTITLEKKISILKVGETLAINGLNFIPGRHILLRSSESKLYELLGLLQNNSTLKIEIQGHICCSPDGSDGYDLDSDSKLLSLNRAINIYDYLVSQGINRDRLSYQGFGPSKPLVKEIDEATRQMNRRVEIKVLEK